MPLLGFKRQFKDAILSGSKTQTLRRPRKYPIKVGDTLYLYVSLRTPKAEKLGEAICTRADRVVIDTEFLVLNGHRVDSADLRRQFAEADGFQTYLGLCRAIEDMYAHKMGDEVFPLEMDRICWQELANNGQLLHQNEEA